MDSSTKPIVYVIHGNDTLAIQRYIAGLAQKVAADPALADMNITRFDGKSSSEDDIRMAAGSMPFLAERRMVILRNPLAKANTDAGRKRFQALLDSLPESTAMLLVFEDTLERGRWKSLHDNHWLRKWLEKAGKKGHYQLCALPQVGAMPEWIRKEAQRLGGQFTPEACKTLVEHVGADTLLASQEVSKLLIYVDGSRPVEAEDVDNLTAVGGEADVFQMVDNMAAGNAKAAIRLLHRLLEEQEPIALFGMIVRQFRLLIQVRELLDAGRGGSAASELRLNPYAVDKLLNQARRFSLEDLLGIYKQLLAVDEASKTGQMTLELAMDTFIAELAR